jgi:mono/diheme cytochrome c family protein
MPDMKLSRKEAELLSAFLIGSETNESESKEPASSQEQIAAGKKAFTALRCSSCHDVEDKHIPAEAATAPLPPVAELKFDHGCLSENLKSANAPDYNLSDDQRAAIRSALQTPAKKRTPAEAVEMRLTQLNCISCHERDDYGGVSPELDSYFHSTEEALGNESRIPPTLTLTGAKLRPEWMNKVLYEGESVRPYMTTRMPQFGTAALDGLTGLFGETDKLEPFEYAPLEKESKPMMLNGAHMLLGDTGLNCIACHNYNGKESPGMKGLDLMTSYQRLQPAWFDQFMRNPGKFRKGIIMPSFWPDGTALQTEILDGNAEDQLRALWFNFSLGRSARDPSGLDVKDPELIVKNTTRTYRGRSEVAGYRGIAVGYPGGFNYAFNAQTGALSAIWTGKYINVGWHGQGSGNFKPAAPAIQLAEDVPFLSEPLDPWPLKPERIGKKSVNPDPLYPRQHGYAFEGYSIAENGIPTLRYRSGEVSIEEVSEPVDPNETKTLRRKLSFKVPKATTLYMRVLTGEIESGPERVFKNDQLQLKLTDGSVVKSSEIRKAGAEGGTDELILRLDLPAGSSSQTIEYTLIR